MDLGKSLQLAVLILALGCLAPAAGARAQALPPAKVAVIDYKRVLNTSSAGKDIHRQIESYRKSLQARIKVDEDKLRATEDELRSQRATLSPEEFQKRRRDFENKVIALKRRAQDWMRALQDTYQQAMAELHKPLLPLVREITQRRGYNIVVDNSQVLMVAKGLDLTDEVIARLNKKIPKMQVPKPKTQ